jgi:hypothetical protein
MCHPCFEFPTIPPWLGQCSWKYQGIPQNVCFGESWLFERSFSTTFMRFYRLRFRQEGPTNYLATFRILYSNKFSGVCLTFVRRAVIANFASLSGAIGSSLSGAVGSCQELSGVVGTCRDLSGLVGTCRELSMCGRVKLYRHRPSSSSDKTRYCSIAPCRQI